MQYLPYEAFDLYHAGKLSEDELNQILGMTPGASIGLSVQSDVLRFFRNGEEMSLEQFNQRLAESGIGTQIRVTVTAGLPESEKEVTLPAVVIR